ncbi:MAG: twin-arginine translocase TatA/TatE family subunit [candidate division Zixibacteria bacterium]|nr:twin-arginine translocase TatA/TatE family subunit [candidate division Zixibacteria bacterium]
MFGMGPWELLLVFLAVLLLFGAKRLPEIASGLGKGIKEFKKAMKDTTQELKGTIDQEPEDTSPSKPDPKKESDKENK